MSVKTTRRLEWEETSPGEWKWLTFKGLCKIADRGRDEGLSPHSFVFFHPEYADNNCKSRVDRLFIEDEEVS